MWGLTWNRMEKPIAVVVGIITLLSVAYGATKWLNHRVEVVVSRRIAPYEHLLAGMTLNADEEYDRAVDQFARSLDLVVAQSSKKAPREERLIPIIDGYLSAIANAERPTDFQAHLSKIERYLNNPVPKYGWHSHHLGWFLLRTGELERAKTEFQKAVQSYADQREYRLAGHAFFGLACSLLPAVTLPAPGIPLLKQGSAIQKSTALKP